MLHMYHICHRMLERQIIKFDATIQKKFSKGFFLFHDGFHSIASLDLSGFEY